MGIPTNVATFTRKISSITKASPPTSDDKRSNYHTGVALTQISAYSTHENRAVRRIMEEKQNSVSTRLKLHEVNDRGRHASIVKGKRASFANISVFCSIVWLLVKVLLECPIRFSTSNRWYAFPNFCTQISRPHAYGVHISSKASATAVTPYLKTLLYPIYASNLNLIKLEFSPNLEPSFSPFAAFFPTLIWGGPEQGTQKSHQSRQLV